MNSTLTLVYWQVGDRINNEILKNERVEYAQEIVPTLSQQLENQYGKSFAERNLRRMMQFANVFPDFEKVSPVATQLSWSHFVELLPLKNSETRYFYAIKSSEQHWNLIFRAIWQSLF